MLLELVGWCLDVGTIGFVSMFCVHCNALSMLVLPRVSTRSDQQCYLYSCQRTIELPRDD